MFLSILFNFAIVEKTEINKAIPHTETIIKVSVQLLIFAKMQDAKKTIKKIRFFIAKCIKLKSPCFVKGKLKYKNFDKI